MTTIASEDTPSAAYVLFSQRAKRGSAFFEFYRCFAPDGAVVLSARAQRLGKPVSVFEGPDEGEPAIEIRIAKGYLLNGRTEVLELPGGQLLGSYTRLNAVLDAEGNKLGRWRDARKWSEEFRENLVDALANALLGSGDVPAGVNPSDTHILSNGAQILARLQRRRMDFHPDPPKSDSPGRFAKLAGRMLPGELGRGIRENLPPFGWSLYVPENGALPTDARFMLCATILRIEMLRWSRSA